MSDQVLVGLIVGAVALVGQLIQTGRSWLEARAQRERDREQRREETRRDRNDLIRAKAVELADALDAWEDANLRRRIEELEPGPGEAQGDQARAAERSRRLVSELVLLVPEGSRLACLLTEGGSEGNRLEPSGVLSAARELLVERDLS